jgi:hypothetical protein
MPLPSEHASCICGLGCEALTAVNMSVVVLWVVSNLKSRLIKVLFKNLVLTSKRTQQFTIVKINRLMLFKEIISIYIQFWFVVYLTTLFQFLRLASNGGVIRE